MNWKNHPAVRAALLMHKQFAEKERPVAPITVPYVTWNRVQKIRRQIDLARARGWQLAQTRLHQGLASAINDCRFQLDAALRLLQAANRAPRRKISVTDIYYDLAALKHEFTEVEIDVEKHEIAATTDPIVLEEIELGRFQIRLDWQLIGRVQKPYRVVALDPHPAARNEDVTHPHVQDEELCEGEGTTAIGSALEDCRLYDFFLLVSQVLHTYGGGSPYVKLRDWNMVPCESCAGYVEQDQCGHCDHCHNVLCRGCSHTCPGCHKSFCFSCMYRCTVCGRRFCAKCRQVGVCRTCSQTLHSKDSPNDSSHASSCDAACLAGQAG